MVKRGLNKFLLFFSLIFLIGFISSCSLDLNLLNQDPYPAIPGENLKVVFQVTGVEDPSCGEVKLKFVDTFPFSIDPVSVPEYSILSGTYVRGYNYGWMVPYTLRVSPDAKEGENSFEAILFRNREQLGVVHKFNVEVKQVKTSFDVYVRDYSKTNGKLTIEIINTGKNDVEALSVELMDGDNVQIKGSSRTTLGILDSKEYTTAVFDTFVEKGELKFNFTYTDSAGIRRTFVESVYFDPAPFILKENGSKKNHLSTIIIVLLVLALIFCCYYNRRKNKRLLMRKA